MNTKMLERALKSDKDRTAELDRTIFLQKGQSTREITTAIQTTADKAFWGILYVCIVDGDLPKTDDEKANAVLNALENNTICELIQTLGIQDLFDLHTPEEPFAVSDGLTIDVAQALANL